MKPILQQAHQQQKDQAAHEGFKRGLEGQDMTLFLDGAPVGVSPRKIEFYFGSDLMWMEKGEAPLSERQACVAIATHGVSSKTQGQGSGRDNRRSLSH